MHTKIKNHFIASSYEPVGVYLYGKIQGLITMSLLPLITFPIYRVYSQVGNLYYYIT
jgi:hypothetical protein